METKRTISEHSQNMNKLGGMNKCNTEWENHYKYEEFILGKSFHFVEKKGPSEITGSSLFSVSKSCKSAIF